MEGELGLIQVVHEVLVLQKGIIPSWLGLRKKCLLMWQGLAKGRLGIQLLSMARMVFMHLATCGWLIMLIQLGVILRTILRSVWRREHRTEKT